MRALRFQQSVEVPGMIRKLASGEYRLYSRKKEPKTGKRRNLYRGSAHAFAADAMARAIAGRGIGKNFDRAFDFQLRPFFYLPFMHHEDMASQLRALVLYEKLIAEGGDPETLRFARLHADL